jgi:vacuolar-type H+-ATPase subunit E/Vma4
LGDESLARHLIGNAEARRDAILSAARDEADRRVARARADADGMAVAASEALARDVARERALRLAVVRGEARRFVAVARAALVEAILARVKERMARLPLEDRFPSVAERLCLEILAELPATCGVVRADATTAEAFRRLAPDARCRFEPLPEGEMGGIELTDEEDTFRLRNTLSSRLRKARPTLVESIGLTLGAHDG